MNTAGDYRDVWSLSGLPEPKEADVQNTGALVMNATHFSFSTDSQTLMSVVE